MKHVHTFDRFVSLNEALQIDFGAPVSTWDIEQIRGAKHDDLLPLIYALSYQELVPIMQQLRELVKSSPSPERDRYADVYDNIWKYRFHLLALDQFLSIGKKLSITKTKETIYFGTLRNAKWVNSGQKIPERQMPMILWPENTLIVDKFSAKPKGDYKGNPMNITVLNGVVGQVRKGNDEDITPRKKVTGLAQSAYFVEKFWRFTDEGYDWFYEFPCSTDGGYTLRLLLGDSKYF